MTLQDQQPRKTLKRPVDVKGTGIHSGVMCQLRLSPAAAGSGIRFKRDSGPEVLADCENAKAEQCDRRTVIIGPTGERFDQIEHVMAAFYADGITDVLAEQQGPEVPFLGGGSREYMELIRAAGTETIAGFLEPFRITRPIALHDGDALIVATPDDRLRLSCFVEFPGTIVGSDGYSIDFTPDAFFEEVSRARTFAVAADLEKLKQAGLARGGSLENAVVFDHEKFHNESLHYPNEVVRHKVIDLLGDLALIGLPLRGHIWAWRAGHRSHVRFAQYLVKELGRPQ